MSNSQLKLLKTCIVLGVLLLIVDYGQAGEHKKKKIVIHVPVKKVIQKHVHTVVKHVHHHHKPIVVKNEEKKIIHEQYHPVVNEHFSHTHNHHENHKHLAPKQPQIEEEHFHHHHNYEHKIIDHNDSTDSVEGFEE